MYKGVFKYLKYKKFYKKWLIINAKMSFEWDDIVHSHNNNLLYELLSYSEYYTSVSISNNKILWDSLEYTYIKSPYMLEYYLKSLNPNI